MTENQQERLRKWQEQERINKMSHQSDKDKDMGLDQPYIEELLNSVDTLKESIEKLDKSSSSSPLTSSGLRKVVKSNLIPFSNNKELHKPKPQNNSSNENNDNERNSKNQKKNWKEKDQVVYIKGKVDDEEIPDIPQVEEQSFDTSTNSIRNMNSSNTSSQDEGMEHDQGLGALDTQRAKPIKLKSSLKTFQGIDILPLTKLFYDHAFEQVKEKDEFWDWNLLFGQVGRKYQ